jgi:hypothetical protein
MVIVRRTIWRREPFFEYLVDTCAGGTWSRVAAEAVEFADAAEARGAMRAAELVLTLAEEIVELERA